MTSDPNSLVGKEVVVYINPEDSHRGKIKYVRRDFGVMMDTGWFPLVGITSGVWKILDADGRLIYENPDIINAYKTEPLLSEECMKTLTAKGQWLDRS